MAAYMELRTADDQRYQYPAQLRRGKAFRIYQAELPAIDHERQIIEVRLCRSGHPPVRFVFEPFCIQEEEAGLWSIEIRRCRYEHQWNLEYAITSQYGRRSTEFLVFEWDHGREELVAV